MPVTDVVIRKGRCALIPSQSLAHRGIETRPDQLGRDRFISDLHLQAAEPGTARALRDYLKACIRSALILGDLFESGSATTCPPPVRCSRADRSRIPISLAGICAELRAFSARHFCAFRIRTATATSLLGD